MRPLRVEMVGFSAFRELTTVDFTDVDLAALWGPTGSGKSTIVDAITFALYGAVARYDDNRLVAPIINQLSTEARVRLDFEVGAERYSAVRVVRRTDRGATTKAAQLERGMEVLASSAREMEPAVEQLLGLDFEQFTKTVVLPQGDFATFLHDRPADRQRLLRRLLDLGVYASMGEEARRRSATAKTKLEALTELLDKGGDITDEQLAEMSARVKDLASLREQLAIEIERLVALSTELEDLGEADARMGRELERLERLVLPAAVSSLSRELGEAEEAFTLARTATTEARGALGKAETAAAAGPDQAVCLRLIEAYSESDAHRAAAEALADTVVASAKTLEEADAKAAEAQVTLVEADDQMQAARVLAGAAGLRPMLIVGQPCPVCEQVVSEVPAHDIDKELAAAEKRRQKAYVASQKYDKVRARAHDKYSEANANLATARKQMLALDKKLSGAPTVDKLEAELEKAKLLAEARVEAASFSHATEANEDKLRLVVDDLRESERKLRRDFGDARDSVAELGPPRPAGESLHTDWTALAKWASATIESVGKARATTSKKFNSMTEKREGTHQTILDLCRPHLDGEHPDNLVEHFAEAASAAKANLEHAERRRKELDDIRAQVGGLETEARVAGELGRLLQAGGFERWLMEEAVIDLVDRATDRLLELSGGQYSLIAHETDFRIQDHRNADEVRDARTLSGGETFLASLSLALALADSIAELAPEGSPQLESIFLDEGFGTLDPETLDLVATAIEELGAAGRMVGIVTHIRELADRMPVRFEVAKGPTSSTVERVEV